MANSHHRETNKLSGQRRIGPLESGLWKICVGAPFLAARNPQRRAFARLANQLGMKTSELKLLPTFLCPNYSRRLSSSNSPLKSGFLKWYLRKLETRPLTTKSISSSLIYTSADITSQIITMPPDASFDLFRMLRITTFGLLIMGPSQHYWFSSMSRIMPRTNLSTTLSKIIMGQTIYGPCMNSIFFSYNAALRGESRDEILARLKRDLLPTLKNGIMYWPLCDFLTFKFVPVQLQPLVNSSFAYLWTIYLTYMASLKKVATD